ncbi:cobalamin (vitamin B12) biosynthesis CbiX protein [Methanocorpusculum labreanum Z]|uniref:Cobalamin (Vitamin B12) biosynthesis CbiX protein n=1 Tax=Methanocorpusculum labreanum (strain ATCC 43576 / DSM 4855 / Z) TaxID=410358 RepID=A2SSE9_METLZ|nr:sirohydrochlorin nickelochelatase [Methanocorpusculum labreanum]ABN07255.1 cobalamin (vitamin B12) biosynthesis CbiX protein [Methanocorpusculum labreanum Z]
MRKHGLLLIGHGSRLNYNKELITSTAELMTKKTDEYLIKTCFMENCSPTVLEGLDSMKTEDIDRLVVVPLFLAKGVHVLMDIPELLDLKSGESRGSFVLADGTKIPLVYAEPIGKDPLLADIMLKNANAALNTHL